MHPVPSCRDTTPERVWSEPPSSTRSSLVPLCTCTTSGLGLRRCANAQQSVGETTAHATTTGNMSLTAPASNKVLSASSVHGLYNHFNSLLAGTSTMLTCYKHLLHIFFLTLFTVWLQLYLLRSNGKRLPTDINQAILSCQEVHAQDDIYNHF